MMEERRVWEELKGSLLFSLLFHLVLLVVVAVWSSRLSAHRWPAPVYTVSLVDTLGPADGRPAGEVKKARVSPVKAEAKEKAKAKQVKPEKPKAKAEPKPKEEPKPKKVEKEPPPETKKIALAPKEQKKPEKPKEPPTKEEKPVAEAKKKEEPTKKEASEVKETEGRAAKDSTPDRQPAIDPMVVSKGGEGEGGGYRGSLFLDGWTNFPFTYYLYLIRNKIGDHWNPSLAHSGSGSALKVVIAFRIYRDGRISEPFIEETSGISFLDQTAVRAVLSSAPFPALPTEFSGDYLGVHFGFEYNYTG